MLSLSFLESITIGVVISKAVARQEQLKVSELVKIARAKFTSREFKVANLSR